MRTSQPTRASALDRPPPNGTPGIEPLVDLGGAGHVPHVDRELGRHEADERVDGNRAERRAERFVCRRLQHALVIKRLERLVDELQPADLTIEKVAYSAFYQSRMEFALNRAGIDNLKRS